MCLTHLTNFSLFSFLLIISAHDNHLTYTYDIPSFLPGWGYDQVLEYFKKSEDNEDHEVVDKNPEYHGKGGYQTVEWMSHVDKNIPVLIKAWQERGYPERDLNAEDQVIGQDLSIQKV